MKHYEGLVNKFD
jgi:uncharacterized membrane protein